MTAYQLGHTELSASAELPSDQHVIISPDSLASTRTRGTSVLADARVRAVISISIYREGTVATDDDRGACGALIIAPVHVGIDAVGTEYASIHEVVAAIVVGVIQERIGW